MRDPDAEVQVEDRRVLRRLREPLAPDHFLRSATAARWVREGSLTPFEVADEHTLVSPRVDFVPQPTEWSDAQLHDAGALTLRLARDLVAESRELKDASAWNVLFDGTTPVFCDLLSVQPAVGREWWAFGQFARHFLLPLWLARHDRLRGHQAFELWRDGVPPDAARRLLGWRRLDPRYAPLLTRPRAAVRPRSAPADGSGVPLFRERLLQALGWMLGGVQPREPRVATTWSRYEDDRPHYTTDGLAAKRQAVAGWLQRIAPRRLVDLGCNAGEFSFIARDAGVPRIVCIDSDHDAVQRLYRQARGDRALSPLVAPLDDLPSGRGWEGREHPGLAARLQEWNADSALMLALVHHIAIACAIPLPAVASFARRVGRRWLVVELIGETDPQLRLLCEQRRRTPQDFGMAAQRTAFLQAGFAPRDEIPVPGTDRVLVLFEADGPGR